MFHRAMTIKMIGKMIVGQVSWKNVTGPITIADYADMVHCFIYLQTVLPQAHDAVAKAAKAVKDALAAA